MNAGAHGGAFKDFRSVLLYEDIQQNKINFGGGNEDAPIVVVCVCRCAARLTGALQLAGGISGPSDPAHRRLRTGRATKTFARIFSGPLAKTLNQTVLVETSGRKRLHRLANRRLVELDGYTLMMAENALVIRPGFKDIKPNSTRPPSSRRSRSRRPRRSTRVANAVPANNMKELIALSHSAAKKLTFASAGVTSVSQLVWDVVRDGASIDAIDVPYRGGGPAMADLTAGHVDLTVPSSQVAKPLVDTARIKCLAVTGKTRSPALPQVPTLAEVGIKHADVDLRFWFAVFGPKGMPAEVTAKLQKAIQSRFANIRAQRPAEVARHHARIRAGSETPRARRQRCQKLGSLHRVQGLKGE